MHRRLRLAALASAVIGGALAATLAAQQPEAPPPPNLDPVLGRWDLTVQDPRGAYPSWLHVHQRKDDQLHAEFVGRFGSVRYSTSAEWDGTQLTVVIPVQYEPNKTDMKFVGKVVGDGLQGTTEDEKGNTITWTAKRAPASTPITTPTWGSPIALLHKSDTGGWKQRSVSNKGPCWSVTDGVLSNTPPCADIITEQTFTDFKLHVELMYPPKSNSGVYLRGRYEVQIQDDFGKAVDSHRLGGVYGFLAPYTNAAKPAGEWQAYDITLVGRRVSIVVNGKLVIDNEIIPGITGGALDSDEAAPGPLMLQGDHGKISFRNVTVTPAR